MLEFVAKELVFFVLLAVLWFALYGFARYQQVNGKWLGRPQRAAISWLGGYSEAFQRVLDLLTGLGVEILDADPNRGEIRGATEGSWRTFGTTIRIGMLTQEGVTFVKIEAGPSASLFDWGESRRFVNRFLQEWDRLPNPVAV